MTDADKAVALHKRRTGFGRKLKEAACVVILYMSLVVVVALAIPTGIFAALIGAVLVLADKLMQFLES